MGLLDRLRPGRGDGPELDAPEAGDPGARESSEPAASPVDVIRPETLWPSAPEWTKVPVMQPSLPEMPVVVSTHFEDSLIARQPPHRFLGDLGHSVSDSAPSGMIEGVAVLVPPAPVDPAESPTPPAARAPEQPLTLAMPASATERTDTGRGETSRRLPGFGGSRRPTYTEAPAADLSETPTAAPEPATASEPPVAEPPVAEPPVASATATVSDGPAPSEPVADLVGAAPIASPPEPMVTVPGVGTGGGTVTAPPPPEMPLAQLPATRLPPEDRTRRLVPALEDEPPAQGAALLSEARGIEPAIPPPPPAASLPNAVP
jgi:hypothetical protein